VTANGRDHPDLAGTPVHYLPVVRANEVIGYLWVSDALDKGDYIQRLAAGEAGFEAAVTWRERLFGARHDGATWLRALRLWVGAPDDTVAGRIAADAQEQVARNLQELEELAFHVENEDISYGLTGWGTEPPRASRASSQRAPQGWRKGPPPRPAGQQPAIRYLPVSKNGDVIGYLWASETDDNASFMRRMSRSREAGNAYLRWYARLDQAESEGLTPLEALHRWVGEPEDPEAGGIPAGTAERWSPNVDVLADFANPTPAAEAKHGPGYASSADGPIRYLPITRGAEVLGYLWASGNTGAAGYVKRASAGTDGLRAGALWRSRLANAKEKGLEPLTALRLWIGAPPYLESGGIAADADEKEAPDLSSLQHIAKQPDG
jgi:hypothetical protein